jgi:hypothetical protein
MPSADLAARIRAEIEAGPGWGAKWAFRFQRFRSHGLRNAGKAMRFLGGRSIAFKIVPVVVLTTIPFTTRYFIDANISLGQASLVSGIVIVCMLMSSLHDSFARADEEGGKRSRHYDSLAVMHRGLVEELTNLPAFPRNAAAVKRRREQIKQVLQCCDFLVKGWVAEYDVDRFNVSLVGFVDVACKRMKVIARAHESQSIDPTYPAEKCLEAQAIEMRRSLQVHDMAKQYTFEGRAKLHDSGACRSMIVIPILQRASAQIDEISSPGAILVESSRPCEFWTARTDSLIKQFMLFEKYLDKLLTGYPYRRNIRD